MRQKLGKSVYGLFYFVMILVSLASVILYNLANWVMDTWGLLSIDEIIFHLKVPLEGTNTEVIEDGVNACLPLAILLLFTIVVLMLGMKNRKKLVGISLLLIMCISVGSASKAAYRVYSDLDVESYLESQETESTFIQDNYVDPRNISLQFPEQKRNLIYIFMESMESTYSSTEHGGGFPENCIPELTEIAEKNVNISNTDKLGGGYPAFGSTWTMGGIFAQTSGMPLKMVDGDKTINTILAENSSFSSSAYNLEDILSDNGYNQCFMIGSNATFGGRRAYFATHGDCEVFDYYTAIEKGLIPEDYYEWWGYEDAKLFAYAKEKLTDLSSQKEPFNLTLLTVDTHFEDGYVCPLCPDDFGDNQYANVMACSSRQVAELIRWIQEQDFYENTTIILSGDHLTMDSDFCSGLDDYERSVYNAFINLPEELDTSFEKTHFREFSTMDMFPTTLAALGVKIEGDKVALGTNLFSDKETLAEQYGRGGLDKKLMEKSQFYQMLLNDIDGMEEQYMQ